MKLFFTLSIALLLGLVDAVSVQAQTMMPLPAHNSVFPGNVRGYWFTAPVDFTIVGVRVPTDAGTGDQNIAVIKLAAAPPAFPTTTNTFTVEALFQNVPGTTIQTTNITVQTGDVIGVLGQRGNANSYATAGNFNTTVGGGAVTLQRLGMQFQLSTTSPQDIWTEPSGSISRTELWYTTCTAPTPQLMAIGDVGCNGDSTGTATAGATGGIAPYTFIWSNGDSTATTANLPAGMHTLTILDSIDCQADTTIEIVEPDTITATFETSDNPCFGDNLGEASVTPMGGVAPFTYSWTTGGSAQNETGMPSGLASVDITDDNGCVVTYSTLITEPAELIADITSVTPVTCENGSDGMVVSSISGGVAPYSVQWDDPNAQLSQTAVNVPEGTWTIMVTDANGCQTNANGSVDRLFDAPDASLGPDVNANNDFYDIIAPAGASAYAWSTGSNSPQIRVFSNGTYSVTVTDQNTCTASDEIIISGIWASSVEYLNNGADVDVFPNPTQGAITVALTNWTSADLSLTVTSVSGQIVQQQALRNLPSEYRQELDLSGLARGLYFLRLESDQGTVVKRIQLQ